MGYWVCKGCEKYAAGCPPCAMVSPEQAAAAAIARWEAAMHLASLSVSYQYCRWKKTASGSHVMQRTPAL